VIDYPSTLTEIANELNISKPEISRHLSKMKEQGLIYKEEKKHKMTNFGETLLTQLSLIEFITENFEFFKEHQLIDLPLEIIRKIDYLKKSEIIAGAGYIFKRMDKLTKESSKNTKLMLDQPFPGVREKPIETALFIIPSYAEEKNLNLDEIQRLCKFFEIKTLPAINISLGIIDDKKGFMFLPDLKGRMDYNNCFYINNPLGAEFLLSIWDYFWAQGKTRYKSE
jgi:DNA-binding Lrp family transcriptional regulator